MAVEINADDLIFTDAIEKRASDIHISQGKQGIVIRYRIDGLLQDVHHEQDKSQENVISRIKVLSGMNIVEHRLPQDGHFEFSFKNKVYSFRASSFPTINGEALVLRILNREDILLTLENIGFFEDQLELMRKILTSSSGMILATGPTGSGKTNLLYSIINAVNKPDVNIITLEDPIEYEMDTIRQGQVNESINFTYNKGVRAILRQDPDIIMLGEIRDSETAQVAVQAALTGILVLSTFHTFNVSALITRFYEFGISNSIIAQSIKSVISTRLVRKICTSCKVAHQLSNTEKIDDYSKKVFTAIGFNGNVFKGGGCEKCNQTGYFGRTGIFEIVYVDDEIRLNIVEQKSATNILALIQKKSEGSLRDSGLKKVIQGITTLDEVIRVLGYTD